MFSKMVPFLRDVNVEWLDMVIDVEQTELETTLGGDNTVEEDVNSRYKRWRSKNFWCNVQTLEKNKKFQNSCEIQES